MVKYYKTTGGYYYKEMKNGDKKRISETIYNKNIMKAGGLPTIIEETNNNIRKELNNSIREELNNKNKLLSKPIINPHFINIQKQHPVSNNNN